jgi:deazaflavin-dependent oxidoreductase (nitroreductase family)
MDMSTDKSSALIARKEAQLLHLFKFVNRFMVLQWQLGQGRIINIWPALIGRMMVLVHTGRKSGQRRFTPVNYAIIDNEIYCIAGFGSQSDWYRNIIKMPEVEIWLPGSWWGGIATDVSEEPSRLTHLRAVLIASGFAASTFGEIHPRKISDDELEEKTRAYRLVRIHRTRRLSGTGGPGDLLLLGWLLYIIPLAFIIGIIWLLLHH